MSISPPPVALSIAGFEPRGAVGLLRDVKIFSLLGVHPVAVPTCLTLQTGRGVELTRPLEASLIERQIHLVASEFPLKFVKVGLLPDQEIIEGVAGALKDLGLHYVLDPILAASSGELLLGQSEARSLQERLFARALLVTPNLTEVERFLGERASAPCDLQHVAQSFCDQFQVQAVLLKGLREGKRVFDGFLLEGELSLFDHPYREEHPRGTGCLLSSAIAAFLARGASLPVAVAEGEAFVERSGASSFQVSSGDYLPAFLECCSASLDA